MTRMTTDVDALSPLLQTGLINAVAWALTITCVGVFVFLIVLSPIPVALATGASVLPAGPGGHAGGTETERSTVAYAAGAEGIHRRCERQPAGELVGRAGGPGLRAAPVQHLRVFFLQRDVNRRYLTDRCAPSA